YNKDANYLIVVYENSNIDIIYENHVINLPDVKKSNFTGSKNINDIYFYNELIYCSTDFGILVINPARNEIKETFALQNNSQSLNINGLTVFNDSFFIATSLGVYSCDVNNNFIAELNSWQKNSNFNSNTKYIFDLNNNLYVLETTNNALYEIGNGQFILKQNFPAPITTINKGKNNFYAGVFSNEIRTTYKLDNDAQLIDSVTTTYSLDIDEENDNIIWIADNYEGLVKYIFSSKNKSSFNPSCPYSNLAYNLTWHKDGLFVSAGGENFWQYTFIRDGFFRLKDNEWKNYNAAQQKYKILDTVFDILDIAIDNKNGSIYAASFGGGLVEIDKNDNITIYKNNGFIQYAEGDVGSVRVTGLAMDEDNNLWISNHGAAQQLVVKKADGSWKKFNLNSNSGARTVSQITIDNSGQKWMVGPNSNGIIVFNDNNTIDNTNDDKDIKLSSGKGNGNLPTSTVNCITKDKDGKLWVGTSDGIGIINCPENIMKSGGCDAELKIVKYDVAAGLLFQNEIVNTIAVDGANNKWIGTYNGVWQITDDAEKILQRFTTNNSPLPSNEIKKIVVDEITGEVFIATLAGLVSFRGNATEPKTTNDDMLIFPNPVPSGYEGTIAIQGLADNSDVRITDVSGKLVYRVKAQGGTATWNGKDYTGNRPATGMYYVFVTNTDGSQKTVGKFIFNE
ncbi:MAG: T9SS type A sorting domain-containing protein, partial [Chitinophagaceae bacterium]|nr:T9SS type A sorting domain-containing protein [Chitinophagaceae bacterium]